MSENPPVNRDLKDKAMDRIDHALGRPIWPLRETYRNHYATTSADAMDFEANPHWAFCGAQDRMAFYAVTDAGRQALTAYLETLEVGERTRAYVVTYEGYETIVPAKSRSHARYANWLRISDSFTELTFGEFVKNAKVRLA
jgi:hypothetical protein